MTYHEYLQSEEWLEIKRKAKTREYYKKCFICGSEENIHLHHRNYNWIGTATPMKAIIPLCKDCHFAVHECSKANKIPYRRAVNMVKKRIRVKQSGQTSLGV